MDHCDYCDGKATVKVSRNYNSETSQGFSEADPKVPAARRVNFGQRVYWFSYFCSECA